MHWSVSQQVEYGYNIVKILSSQVVMGIIRCTARCQALYVSLLQEAQWVYMKKLGIRFHIVER